MGQTTTFKISTIPPYSITRRFSIPTSNISWYKFETKVREIFQINPNVPIGLTYTDEEGDEITFSSEIEFQEIFAALKLENGLVKGNKKLQDIYNNNRNTLIRSKSVNIFRKDNMIKSENVDLKRGDHCIDVETIFNTETNAENIENKDNPNSHTVVKNEVKVIKFGLLIFYPEKVEKVEKRSPVCAQQ
ncbi:2482_t:CDS:1 [Diversispora eburnea]|uniref:2482_t:CDS:1 n=1 Tax=Diversispora eburnea TaxID=1213867 RepID=A0A9N9FCV8_9GLOM|nr:2482_t:CDS:1 [Diversispora eburnea]